MTLVFVTEARFQKDLNGNIYSMTGGFSLNLWSRYLDCFEKIVVVARVEKTDLGLPFQKIANSDKVTFIELPYYVGFSGYLSNYLKMIKVLKEVAIPGRSYICRVPGMIGSNMAAILKRKRIPYGAEIVGDPQDVYSSSGGIQHPLRWLFRNIGIKRLKNTVLCASATLYVTKHSLQDRYPSVEGVFTTNASNVVLPDNLINNEAAKLPDSGETIRLMDVGQLAHMYKGADLALEAMARLIGKGYNCELVWLGDGIYLEKMIELAKSLGIEKRVMFLGNVSPSSKVREWLSTANLFIHPSRAEGLPRAIIEAMSMGLPCISTRVGGIPELLGNEALIDVNDIDGLTARIESFILNVDLANSQAKRNLEESKNYSESLLQQKRRAFYEELIRLS